MKQSGLNIVPLLLFCLASLLPACRSDIQLDLEVAPRQLVVNALLSADSTQTFTLTQSGGFYERELFPIQNATLTLRSFNMPPETLVYDAGGRYLLPGFSPQLHQQYLLDIEHEGSKYAATTTFPRKVSLLGADFFINVANTNLSGFSVQILDPVGEANYYRVIAAIEGNINPASYNLFSDENGQDGDTLRPLFYLGPAIDSGYHVDLKLLSLDKAAYDYYQQISRAIIATNTSNAPFNPRGNFSGNVLGYFGSADSDTMSFIVQ